MEIKDIIGTQRVYFKKGMTLEYKVRKEYLLKLKNAIIKHQDDICKALFEDLNKSSTESYMTEIGMTLSDLSYQIKHLKENMKKRRVKTPIAQFKSKSYILPSPRGNVLIISPWNYPFLLAISPLAGAIASGNTVVLKPSELSVSTSNIIKMIIEEVFPSEYCSVTLGDYLVAEELLGNEFDYIFYTGSERVGKKIYQKASETLTPVTLELGGKSPCIVDETAKLRLAAKRIVFGKFLNCGQTCVAPDYVLVKEEIKEVLVKELKYWINKLYPNWKDNPNYGKIINKKHFSRIIGYLEDSNIIYGGGYDEALLRIEPTILDSVIDDNIMKDEIFGPILPILGYDDFNDILDVIEHNPNPLALYIFSGSKKNIEFLTRNISYGGGCINDTIIHLASNDLPFGGIKSSGIGNYHGKRSFDIFSHEKSIVNKSTRIDLPMRYTPYTNGKEKLIKKFLK